MQKNENPVVLSAVLLVISLVVALLLAFTNSVTKDKIKENTIKEQDAAKQEDVYKRQVSLYKITLCLSI